MDSTPYIEPPKHRKAMRIHLGLAIFYGVMAVLFLAGAFWESSRYFAFPPLFVIVGAAHGAIAFGASRLSKLAQVCSIIVAVLMLVGVPIGTTLGIYLLRNAAWVRASRKT